LAEAPEQGVLGWLRRWEGLWHFLIHIGRKQEERKLTLLSKMATSKPRQVVQLQQVPLSSKKKVYFCINEINIKCS
jgi:hypothetical protein